MREKKLSGIQTISCFIPMWKKNIAWIKEKENSCKLDCGANTGMNAGVLKEESDIKNQTEEPKA